MATLDFTPLYHSTVGFDRLPDLLAHALTRDESGYPPYNIEKTGDDAYRIVMALAGFSRDDIEIVSERNRLSIRGALKGKNENTFLHQGIAQRSFQRVLDLADYIVVTGASMNDGLLVIDLKRELPEALKPRRIEINATNVTPIGQKAVDNQAA
jgi:molecular chaperone IbpA